LLVPEHALQYFAGTVARQFIHEDEPPRDLVGRKLFFQPPQDLLVIRGLALFQYDIGHNGLAAQFVRLADDGGAARARRWRGEGAALARREFEGRALISMEERRSISNLLYLKNEDHPSASKTRPATDAAGRNATTVSGELSRY